MLWWNVLFWLRVHWHILSGHCWMIMWHSSLICCRAFFDLHFWAPYIKRIKFKFVGVLVNCIKCTSTTWRHSCIETGFTAVKIAFGYTHRTVCLHVIYTEISYNALSHYYTFFHTHGHLNYLLSYGLFTAFRFGRPNHNGFFALGCAFEIHTSCI